MKYFVLLLVTIANGLVAAQPIMTAEMQYAPMRIEFPDSVPLPDDEIVNQFERLIMYSSVNIAFNTDTYAIVLLDEYGDIATRMVFMKDTDVFYLFENFHGEMFYDIVKTSTDVEYPFGWQEISREHSDSTFFGIPCDHVFYQLEGIGTMEAWLTDSVQSPIADLVMQNSPLKGLVFSLIITGDDVKAAFRIKSYSPTVLHHEWFSVSTTAASSKAEFRERFSISDTGYSGYEGNQDILDKLVEDKILSSDEYFYERLKENHGSIDKLNILAEIRDTIISQPLTNVAGFLSRYGLLTPSMKEATERLISNSESDEDLIWSALFFSALKDHMHTREVRDTIIANLAYAKVLLPQEVTEQYRTGSIELQDYLMHMDQFKPLPKYEGVVSLHEAGELAAQFLQRVFEGDNIVVSVSVDTSGRIVIQTDPHSYTMPKERIQMGLWDEDDEYIVLDSVEIGIPFYELLLNKARQIAADNNISKAYGIFDFNQLFVLYRYHVNGRQLRENYPDLGIQDYPAVLQVFDREKASPHGSIGTSFLDNENEYQNAQLEITSLFAGDGAPNVEYVTTDVKKRFIEYVQAHATEMRVDSQWATVVASHMFDELCDSPYGLMELLPQKTLTVRTMGSSIELKVDNTDMKTSLPDIYRLLKDDLEVNNIRYGKNRYQILFDVNGTPHTASAEKESVLNTLGKILKEDTSSDKELYTKSGLMLQITSKTYYYLSKQERADLQQILGVRFEPIVKK